MTDAHGSEISLRLDRVATKRLLWAFGISIALHLFIWGAYEGNKRYHILDRIRFPAWMQSLAKALVPQPKPKDPVNPEVQMVFVEVSPSQAVTEAPKDTPFYSKANARAANRDLPKNSNIPKLDGKQENVVKTATVEKNQFDKLMPTVPAAKGETAEEKRAKAALIQGDLTLAKPDPNPPPKPEQGAAEQSRPRTVKEAMLRNQQLAGQMMKQDGGARSQQLEASFDTRATSFGLYDSQFIAAVQDRWYKLIDNISAEGYRQGKVQVQFTLTSDGKITDLKVIESTVPEILSLACQKSILDPAPYEKWTRDMRLMVGKDYREIKFSFYYN